MRDFALFFGIQCLQYFLITCNYRAIAHGSYFWTGATDLTFAAVNFAIIKKIAQSEKKTAWAGYTLGGVAGSLSAIYLTKLIFGA